MYPSHAKQVAGTQRCVNKQLLQTTKNTYIEDTFSAVLNTVIIEIYDCIITGTVFRLSQGWQMVGHLKAHMHEQLLIFSITKRLNNKSFKGISATALLQLIVRRCSVDVFHLRRYGLYFIPLFLLRLKQWYKRKAEQKRCEIYKSRLHY